MSDTYRPTDTGRPEQDRENQAIARALSQVNNIPIWNKEPERFPFGMIFATEEGAWDPGSGVGIYYSGYDGIYKRLDVSGDTLLGVYNQTTDVPTLDCNPDPGDIFPGDYYILEVNGVFSSSCSNIAGETGNVGDLLIWTGIAWETINEGANYLSSVTADTAEGHITLNDGGTSNTAPVIPTHIARLAEVTAARDSSDAADATQNSRLDDLEAWDIDHVDPVANPDPHSQYLLPEELPSTAVTYLSALANGSDYSLINTPPTNPEAALSGTVGGDDVLVVAFINQTPLQQDLLYAELQTMTILDLNGQNNDTFVYPIAWLNHAAGGGRTELGRGSPQLLAETRATYHFPIQILGPITAPAGDWTSIEVYGTKDGGGPDRTVTVYVDGSGASRNITYLPIPAYPAEHGTTHNNDGSDPIPDLQEAKTKNDEQDTELARLEADKLDTADAVNTFSFAAYLSIKAPLNTSFPDLGAAWQDLDILTEIGGTPRYISSLGNGQFAFEHEGAYVLLVSGSFEHNSSNSGRITYFRMHNYTDGIDEPGIVSGTGRNAEATPISVNTIVDIAASDVGKTFGAQIGNGDAYSAVNFQALGVSVFNVGEWREPLG